MAQDNVDVIQTMWDAFGRGDIEKATSVADPSAVRCARDAALGRDLSRPRGLGRPARLRRRQLRQVRGQAREGPRRRRRPRRRGRAHDGAHEGRPGRRAPGGLGLQDAQRPGPARRRFHGHGRPARRARLSIRLSVVTVTFNSAARGAALASRARGAAARRRRADRRGQRLERRHRGADPRAGPRRDADRGRLEPRLRGRLQPRRRAAGGELLVLLNPDAVAGPGWRDAIERPPPTGAAGRRGWRSSPPRTGAW